MNKFDEAAEIEDLLGYSTCPSIIDAVHQALAIATAVEKHKLVLKEYKEAGDKATEGKWEWEDRTVDEDGYVYIPQGSYLVGNICLADTYEDGTLDCDFITKAANSRNVIKDILKELEG